MQLDRPAGPEQASIDRDAFMEQLIELIPQMRAFGRYLCRDPSEAEDLAQDALYKALKCRSGYTLGTNLKAWTFKIMRNLYYSSLRKSGRWVELTPERGERLSQTLSDPIANLELDEVRRALNVLADEQREALILVAAGGLSYDEAAHICRCPVGTIKSRVSRARDLLAATIENGGVRRDEISPSRAMALILKELAGINATQRAA